MKSALNGLFCSFDVLFILVFLAACSTQPEAPRPSTWDQVPPQHSWSRAASALDPQNPPSLQWSLVNPLLKLETASPLTLSLEENPSAQVSIKVQNFPLAKGWQEIQILLNDQAIATLNPEAPLLSIPAEKFRSGFNLVRAFLMKPWGESLPQPNTRIQMAIWVAPYSKQQLKNLHFPFPTVYIQSPKGIYVGEQAKKITFDVVHFGNSKNSSPLSYSLNGKKRVLKNQSEALSFLNLEPGKYVLKILSQTTQKTPFPFSSSQSEFEVR